METLYHRGMRCALMLVLLVACGHGRDRGDFCDDACVCEAQSACAGSCGDDCDLGCRDVSTCDIECIDGCTTICERVSSCTVDCGIDCDVTCRDLSSCDVVMETGQVICERVSACNIDCATGGGIVDAVEASPGVFTCP